MIQLLVMVILGESSLLLVLFSRTYLREPVAMALDCFKRGRGPVIVRNLEGTFLAVFLTCLYSILMTRRRSIGAAFLNPTDQVLLAQKKLEASLTGFLLFLSIMINRMVYLIREQSLLEKIIKTEEKQFEERKFRTAEQLKALGKEADTLKAAIMKVEFECQAKTNKAEAAKAAALALKVKYEEFRLEYDLLLEYNETLRNQLQSIDQGFQKDHQGEGWTNLNTKIMCNGVIQFPWDIQTPKMSKGEIRLENEVDTSNQHLFIGSHATSSPRQRRPILQH